MAVVPYTELAVVGDSQHKMTRQWLNVTESDTAQPLRLPRPGYGVTVQASGTWGSATLTLEGSLDGVTYAALPQVDGSDLTLTADGLRIGFALIEYVRPTFSGGTGQDVSVTLMLTQQPERYV